VSNAQNTLMSLPAPAGPSWSTAVVRSIRLLVIWAIVAASLYSVFAHAQRGGCLGGIDGAGGWVDAAGRATGVEPQCYELSLGPSPFVFFAIAVTVVFSLTRVMRRARTEHDAVRILSRGGVVVAAIALVSLAVGQTWFFLLPVEQFADGSGTLLFPFPFAAAELDLSPLSSR
jgi:hypothetical protein